MRLEKTISSLAKERISLITQLEAHIITDKQIQTIESFAAQVRQGLEIAGDDFQVRGEQPHQCGLANANDAFYSDVGMLSH